MAYSNKRLSEILFVDIETAGEMQHLGQLPSALQKLWAIKAKQISRKDKLTNREYSELYEGRAGIYAEFAKVVCISVGFFVVKKGEVTGFRVKSFAGHDEYSILKEFSELLKKHFDKPKNQAICGHNIKEFDIPFLCRRMVIHSMKLPKMLDITGKKPWEIDHLMDTLHLWRFGDYKNYTSLALLAAVFGIPTPKDDIDGSMIHHTFWKENDIARIVKYCEKDVLTVAKVFARINLIDLPPKLAIHSRKP